MGHGRVLVATVIASISNSSFAQSLPDGWGPYHFGMSAEQVQALPHTSWAKLEFTKGTEVIPDIYRLKSRSLAVLNGRSNELTVFFGATKRLDSVALERDEPSAHCEAVFQRDLKFLEQRYGDFSAAQDEGLQTTGDRVEYRSLPGGKSKYDALIAKDDPNPLFHAHRVQGDRFLDLMASDTNGKCNVSLSFDDDHYK